MPREGEGASRRPRGQNAAVDKRSAQFVNLIHQAAPPLLAAGFVQGETEMLGAPGRRPYSVRVRFQLRDLEVASQLTLAHAGEEVVSTKAVRAGSVVFESS